MSSSQASTATQTDQKPYEFEMPRGQKVLAIFSLGVSIFAAATFGAAFHEGNLGCLASCAALGAASFVFAIYLLAVRGRQHDVSDGNWKAILTVEKRRTLALVAATALTIIFGACLATVAIETPGQIGCLAACTALTTASFVAALCILAKKKETFAFRTEGEYNPVKKVQNFWIGETNDKFYLSGKATTDHSVFRKIRVFQSVFFASRETVCQGAVVPIDKQRGFHLKPDLYLEVIDTVEVNGIEMIRRRKFPQSENKVITEYSRSTNDDIASFFTGKVVEADPLE